MGLLVYAVIERTAGIPSLSFGVAGAPITDQEIADLRVFYSLTSSDGVADPRSAALEFHRVIQKILAGADLVPFRFPTSFSGETELRHYLEAHATEYRAWLERVRGHVQMEIRIALKGAEVSTAPDVTNTTGGDYLRSRHRRLKQLETAAAAFETSSKGLVTLWKQRPSSDYLRCFALIRRERVSDFLKKLAGAEVSSELVARVSGPWPASEFFAPADHP
jgi:hypothetical protein